MLKDKLNKGYEYEYSSLNIYDGRWITIRSNRSYDKWQIVDGEWDIKEGYHYIGNSKWKIFG